MFSHSLYDELRLFVECDTELSTTTSTGTSSTIQNETGGMMLSTVIFYDFLCLFACLIAYCFLLTCLDIYYIF